jgi:hypothetical protein
MQPWKGPETPKNSVFKQNIPSVGSGRVTQDTKDRLAQIIWWSNTASFEGGHFIDRIVDWYVDRNSCNHSIIIRTESWNIYEVLDRHISHNILRQRLLENRITQQDYDAFYRNWYKCLIFNCKTKRIHVAPFDRILTGYPYRFNANLTWQTSKIVEINIIPEKIRFDANGDKPITENKNSIIDDYERMSWKKFNFRYR